MADHPSLTQLQEKLTFLEHDVAQLDEVIRDVGGRVDALSRQLGGLRDAVTRLNERLDSSGGDSAGQSDADLADDKPPHW